MNALRGSVVLLLSAGLALAAAPVVEHVTTKPTREGGLGTTDYAPSPAEEPFFSKLGPDEWKTGGMMTDYALSKRDGVFVGWFGVVRKVTERKGATTLLVEHKGFDGLTDSHILALDFNGSGDFTVQVPGVGHGIERLSLVKVYGKARVTKGALPEVNAEFVRNWSWGTFTFLMAAGEQRGSEVWRKLNSVNLTAIYDPYPDDHYYERRLGKR